MRMKKAVKLILPVILLTFMWAGGYARGDDDMGTMAVTGTQTCRVCLPPAWSLKLPTSTRFETVLDGEAVLDWETGLVWEKSPNTTTRSWSGAVSYAYHKTVGGRKGWSLPTIEELARLVDTTQSSPALPSGHPFTNALSYFYWSSTTNVNNTNNACLVHFGYGSLDCSDKSLNGNVWCVRGGHGHDGQ